MGNVFSRPAVIGLLCIHQVTVSGLSIFYRDPLEKNQALQAVEVENKASVSDLRTAIATATGIPRDSFQISYGGVLVDGTANLADAGICNEAEVGIVYTGIQSMCTYLYTGYKSIVLRGLQADLT